MSAPPEYEDPGFADLIVQLLLAIASIFVRSVFFLMVRIVFADSQRAEYFADATSALVAGRRASQGMLELTKRVSLIDRAVLELYPFTEDQGSRIFDKVRSAIRDASADNIERVTQAADAELLAVDATHPATIQRQTFLAGLELAEDPLPSLAANWPEIDVELASIKHDIGRDWMASMVEY